MYGKIFRQIYDSSIVEDPDVRFTFMDFVVLADSDGVVDMTQEAIARKTNRPLDIIRSTIVKLESPDPRSRTNTFNGARLVRIDDHRDWGWRIVNYEIYREMKCEFDRKSYMRNYMKKRRAEKRKPLTSSLTEVNVVKLDPSPSSSPSSSVQGGDARGGQPELLAVPETAESVYDAYPRKVGKPAALRAIRKQISNFGIEVVITATRRFAEAWKGETDLQYCPHPATWFNQERFNDKPETWRTGSPSTNGHSQNPRNVGTCKGTTNYGQAAKRILERQEAQRVDREMA